MNIMQIWKNFNQSAKIIFVVLAVALAGSFYNSCSTATKLDEWRGRYDDFTARAESVVTVSDSLALLVAESNAKSDSLAEVVDSVAQDVTNRDRTIRRMASQRETYEVRNDSSFSALTEGKTQEEIVAVEHPTAVPWVGLSYSLREENLFLRESIDTLNSQRQAIEFASSLKDERISVIQTSLFAQTERADSLHAVVIAIPPAPPKEKFLFFNLPSRKTSFIVGAIVGVAGSIALDKAIGGN